MKITEATTLGELTIISTKLGRPAITMATLGTSPNVRRVLLQHDDHDPIYGEGETEAMALDNAFTKLRAAIGAKLKANGVGPIEIAAHASTVVSPSK